MGGTWPVAGRMRAGARRLADIACAGWGGGDAALWRAELAIDHRVRARRFIAELVPKGGRGAELGVYTGLFSPVLLAVARPREAWFVDVWDEAFGPRYPDWGAYTAWGALETAVARRAAQQRIARAAAGCACEVVTGRSETFLESLAPHGLDWAYLDTGHTYDGTLGELRLLATRLRPGGILIGDDWDEDPASPHHGVCRAGREAVARGWFELVGVYGWKQYALRAAGHLQLPGRHQRGGGLVNQWQVPVDSYPQ